LVTYESVLNGKPLSFDSDVGFVKGVAYNIEEGVNKVFATTENGVIVTFALYNIGVGGSKTCYKFYDKKLAVRPYSVFEDSNGNEFIYYADMVSTAFFDVTDAILSESTANSVAEADLVEYFNDVVTVRNIVGGNAYNAYKASGRNTYIQYENTERNIVLNALDEDISIHTELQANYLKDDYLNIANYADGTEELSRPLTITLSWNNYSSANGAFYGYLLTFSENSDLSEGKQYALKSNSMNIYNLRVGTDYYWNVIAIYSNGMYASETDKFSTEDTCPRNIYIDGVTNVRDIGGWTIDGKKTKQGLIYRSADLDNTTAAGRATLFEELGVKSEIDIRMEDESLNKFGDSINYYPCYMTFSGNIFTSNAKSFVKFFEILGDESNYPIIFHCSIGTDRTGLMSFFLNGLLNASEDQLRTDYLFSNFGNIRSSRDTLSINWYINLVKKKKGDTFSEKTKNYLLGYGVKAEDIDTFIRIMTE